MENIWFEKFLFIFTIIMENLIISTPIISSSLITRHDYLIFIPPLAAMIKGSSLKIQKAFITQWNIFASSSFYILQFITQIIYSYILISTIFFHWASSYLRLEFPSKLCLFHPIYLKCLLFWIYFLSEQFRRKVPVSSFSIAKNQE